MENKELNFEDLQPLGFYVNQMAEKTASDKASENLTLDSYFSGLEAGLGLEEGVQNQIKIACQAVGREIMMDFVPGIFLSK